MGSLEVKIKALQMSRSSFFVKLSPRVLMLLALLGRSKMSLLVVAFGGACWSAMVKLQIVSTEFQRLLTFEEKMWQSRTAARLLF